MILTPPPYNPQSSIFGDTDSCGPQAILHALEMLQGNAQRWSPRGLAKLSGTKPGVGTKVSDVVDAINEHGLIPYDLWPDPPGDNWTLQTYFEDIPQSVLDQANKNYVVSLTNDLSKFPLLFWVAVSPKMSHFMAQFNSTEVFDSYQPSVKPTTTWQPSAILNKWGISLKPKTMTLGFQVSGNPTVYIQAGNSLVPLADWQAFVNLGGSKESIVPLTQTQLDSLSVVYNDLFKTQ